MQPPTGRWHRATVDRHLHPSKSLPSSNHILLAKALYFARHCSNSHTCALACHKYIALDGVATRIENQCVWRLIISSSNLGSGVCLSRAVMLTPTVLSVCLFKSRCPSSVDDDDDAATAAADCALQRSMIFCGVRIGPGQR